MQCLTCKWFDITYHLENNATDENDQLSFCNWPKEWLPYSLRYGALERLMVAPTDGAGCFQHEERE